MHRLTAGEQCARDRQLRDCGRNCRAGSLLSSKGFSATAGTAACTDSNLLQGAVQAGNGSPAMGRPSPEPQGGHALEKGNSSGRVETAPRVGSDDLEPLRESGGGFVRHE